MSTLLAVSIVGLKFSGTVALVAAIVVLAVVAGGAWFVLSRRH